MKVYSDAYILQAISPMHVGSGDSNYGVIDKLVQRDPINDHPIINASSLKGALREYFKYTWERKFTPTEATHYVHQIFGGPADLKKDENGKKKRSAQSMKGRFI